MDYSPWGRKESDMTEQLSLSLHILCEDFMTPCGRLESISLDSTTIYFLAYSYKLIAIYLQI